MRKRPAKLQSRSGTRWWLPPRWGFGLFFLAGVILALAIHHRLTSTFPFHSLGALFFSTPSHPPPPWGQLEETTIVLHRPDDVVFTKKGVDDLQPWVLTKLPQMRALYTSGEPLEVVAYRRKSTL